MKCLLLQGNTAAKEDAVYELPAEVCKKWFNGSRYCRIGTIGDGSCFFHSTCLGLNVAAYQSMPSAADRQKIAGALRKALSDSFTPDQYAAIFKTLKGVGHKSYEEIKEGLKNPKTWAEEIMIKWASKYLGANIIFLNLSNNENKPYCGVHDIETLVDIKNCSRPGVPTVLVAWINSSHFELIARLDDITAKEVTLRTAFDPKNEKDHETIRHIMRSYKTHCKI